MSLLTRLMMLLVLALLLAWSGKGHAGEARVTDNASVRLRAEASSRGAVLAVLPPGTAVEVLEEKDGYARIAAGAKKGWMAKHLLAARPVSRPVPASAGHQRGPVPPQRSGFIAGADETRQRGDGLTLARAEQERTTWLMIGVTAGVAFASFVTGFWLRGALFRQRYGWLAKGGSRNRRSPVFSTRSKEKQP